jgi:hypothetical protein
MVRSVEVPLEFLSCKQWNQLRSGIFCMRVASQLSTVSGLVLRNTAFITCSGRRHLRVSRTACVAHISAVCLAAVR